MTNKIVIMGSSHTRRSVHIYHYLGSCSHSLLFRYSSLNFLMLWWIVLFLPSYQWVPNWNCSGFSTQIKFFLRLLIVSIVGWSNTSPIPSISYYIAESSLRLNNPQKYVDPINIMQPNKSALYQEYKREIFESIAGDPDRMFDFMLANNGIFKFISPQDEHILQ